MTIKSYEYIKIANWLRSSRMSYFGLKHTSPYAHQQGTCKRTICYQGHGRDVHHHC